MTHDLKCWTSVFQDVYLGVKSFEIRVNDRDYKVGDTLHLREYNPETDAFTGRWVSRRVTYILRGGQWGLPGNLVVMAIV